jgi:oligopeptide/dipeptide ABC transporter ATP-binding protein
MTMMSNNTLLHVEDLRTYFFLKAGVLKAVDGISLDILEREAVGLVGESGCGKSITAFSIMRVIPIPGKITGGRVEFRNKSILGLTNEEMSKIRGKDISMVFQDPMTYLNPVFSTGQQITEAILLHQHSTKKEATERGVELLRLTGIPEPKKIMNYYPHQLSGGMRQRVLIAMAVACNPSLLIADEPTTALDVTVQAQILRLINDLKQRMNMSLLLITHDLRIVADMCDRVYVMYAGKIVESGTVWQIFENPLHPYTVGLLNCVLSIEEFKKTIATIEGTVPHLINSPSGCRFRERCSFAMEKCRLEDPTLIEIEDGHSVSCFLHKH